MLWRKVQKLIFYIEHLIGMLHTHTYAFPAHRKTLCPGKWANGLSEERDEEYLW